MAKKQAPAAAATATDDHFHLSPFHRAEVEARANEVSKANGPKGSQFFVGMTTNGHGLIETDADGKQTTHYGTKAELLAILNA